VLLEHVVTMVNLGMRRTGLAPGTEGERDPEQVQVAIEAVRAVMPLVESVAPRQLIAIRDALSQLQLAFVRIGGSAPEQAVPTRGEGPPPASAPPPPAGSPPAEPEPEEVKPGEPGPAERSGRLWLPGQ
jgi:hypothetical protein